MVETDIKFEPSQGEMLPAPIAASWILEGSPTARTKFLSGSSDGTSNTYIWDCTAGRFRWRYNCDETLYVLEGLAFVKDAQGIAHNLDPGMTVFFPAGSSAEWTVPQYVRKFAILRVPLPGHLALVNRAYSKLKRMIWRDARGDGPVMFQTG